MSCPAQMLRRELVRRLNGQCRVSLTQGRAMNFLGDALGDFSSCAACPTSCAPAAASGITGERLPMAITLADGEAKIRWPCPACGRETVESVSLLQSGEAVKQVEADPLCFSCRNKPSP